MSLQLSVRPSELPNITVSYRTLNQTSFNMSLFRDSNGSQPRHKTMSTSVRRLQEALNMHLDVQQKTDFVNVLNQFHITRDVRLFIKNLKELLDTPAKKQIFSLIRKVIPKSDVEEFDRYCRFEGRKYDTMPAKRSKKTLQRSRSPLPMSDASKMLPMKQKQQKEKKKKKKEDKGTGSDSSRSTHDGSRTTHNGSRTTHDGSRSTLDSSRSTHAAVSMKSVKSLRSAFKDKGNDVKHIQILQSGDPDKQGFGFSIRGGSEYGIGIYVSMVDTGGAAEHQGLVPGDLLMEVNDISFDKISHNEAAKIIRAAKKLDMKICRVGRIPGSFVVHQMYKWVDGQGRPVSPPPELEQIGQLDSMGRKSGFMLLKGTDERKVNVTVQEGQNLGLMIRGGREFGLGIYISGVDAFSPVDKAGLKVGDQILDVNGNTYLDITHAEAVRLLKLSAHLIFTIKDVGKLPYARTKIDQTSWLSNSRNRRTRTDSQNSGSTMTQSNSRRSAFTKGIGSQLMLNSAISTKWDLIENQATELLNETEQGTLRYYLSEYNHGFITVDGLTMASFELLNTKAKMTMMTEIRNLVRPRDLDKFDILLQRREARQKQGFRPESYSTYSLDGVGGQKSHDNTLDRSRRSEGVVKMSMSAPSSRAATMRDRSGQVRRQVAEMELEPLRLAIEQIEDDPDFMSENLSMDDWETLHASQLRSSSMEQLHSPNLHKTSLSTSRRSLSVETLTPVYIDVTSDLPQPRSESSATSRLRAESQTSMQHRSRSRSNSASQRPRSSSASRRPRSGSSYSHRQRSGSNSSTLRRRHKSVEDVRIPSHRSKVTPYPSRRNSDNDIRAHLSSASFTHLKDVHSDYPDSPRSPRLPRSQRSTNVVYAQVHQQPRTVDGSPSDDSGVELNGNHANENINNRVTISSDRPVDIDDVLERRSSIISVHDHDHSNHSTLTNHSEYSHSNASTLTNQRAAKSSRSSLFGSSLSVNSSPGRHFQNRPPVEIRINDGDGSIDTMSIENPSSPHFINQSYSSSRKRNQSESSNHSNNSFVHQSYSLSHNKNQSESSRGRRYYDSDDEPETFEIHSEMGDSSDLFVSPLDRVLDEENGSYSDVSSLSSYHHEARQIAEARQRYGDIPLEIIPIYKTKPTLGMAIEGGANTRQPLPRVINLQPGGSAYESGGLKVGHVILEVNQNSLVGLEHVTAAKTIAEAFKNKSLDNMELLVTESGVAIKNYP